MNSLRHAVITHQQLSGSFTHANYVQSHCALSLRSRPDCTNIAVASCGKQCPLMTAYHKLPEALLACCENLNPGRSQV